MPFTGKIPPSVRDPTWSPRFKISVYTATRVFISTIMSLLKIEIPFPVTRESLFRELKTTETTSLAKTAEKILHLTRDVLKGYVLYKPVKVDDVTRSGILLGETLIASPTLGTLLEKNLTVYPNIITCIGETDSLINPDDLMENLCVETVKSLVLKQAVRVFQDHLEEKNSYPVSFAHPGSMKDWDISELGLLFNILDIDPETGIVRLSKGFVMIPLKTTAGIAFHAPRQFINCTACDRENCPERRAPYSGASADNGRQP